MNKGEAASGAFSVDVSEYKGRGIYEFLTGLGCSVSFDAQQPCITTITMSAEKVAYYLVIPHWLVRLLGKLGLSHRVATQLDGCRIKKWEDSDEQ